MADSQTFTLLSDVLFDDPSQLSQVLRQRAGSEQGLCFTTSTDSHGSPISVPPPTFTVPPHPRLGAVPQLLPVAPEHAPPSRRVVANTATQPYHVTSGATKHHSAPVSTAPMDAVLAPKMHHSFAGIDAPGDTQPDSQMHKDWTSGIFGTADTATRMPSPRSGLRSLFAEHDDEDDVELLSDDVEVIASSQIAQDAAITSPTALEDDRGPSLRTDDAFTSPLKFETPAVAARERIHSGQMLSSTAGVETTPDTVASASAFGGAFGRSGVGQPLSLTQAFDLTQARTSPVIAGTEDPVFQRPSPNFNTARHSSPIPALSSPIKVMRQEWSEPAMRSSSEPRSEYVTMKESQERRRSLRGAQRTPLVQEDSWEELSAAQKRLQRQRQREQNHRAAGLSLSSISAPAIAPAYGVRKRRGDAQRSPNPQDETPQPTWHDGVLEDDDVAMEDPSQHLALEDDNVDRSLDELSQDIAAVAHARMRYSGLENGIQVLKTSSHPPRTQPELMPANGSRRGSPGSQLQRESQIQAPASQSILRTTPHSSRGSVAVMDSQPDLAAGPESWPRPDNRFPSSPSVNQYSINQTTVASRTGYTSQMISSSMVRMPPGMSQDAGNGVKEGVVSGEEERVPSSPPMLTDELTYDEHGYEEHSEEDLEREPDDVATDGGDARIDEEDDLPTVEPAQAAVEENPLAASTPSALEAKYVSEAIRPIKVDDATDHEIPETLEEDRDFTPGSGTTGPSGKLETATLEDPAMPAPRLKRNNTIPETDTLEETQPSHFAEEALLLQENPPPEVTQKEPEVHDYTNSTEPFHIAQEQQAVSRSHMPAPHSSRDEGSDSLLDVSRIRSLNDIANLPNTQRSTAEDEIDIPSLIGFDDINGDTHMSSPVPAAKRRRAGVASKSSVFHSPAKQAAAVEQLQKAPPSPFKYMQQMREETPPTASAQAREEKGALAAAQARDNITAAYGRPATLKTKRASRPVRPQNSKKGSLKSARAVIATMSSPNNSPSKPKASATATTQKPAPATPTRKTAKSFDKSADVEMRDAGESTDELASSPPPSTPRLAIRLTPRQAETHGGEVVVPNRVFASWPGSHYYPATCIGRPDSKQLQVRFDDGNSTTLDAFQVRSLDLRPGDQVKVDQPGMKKYTYVVVGLTEKCDDLHNYEFPMTDRYGHVSVILEEKQRDSLPPGMTAPLSKQVTVHIASVYLTTQLWGRLRNRTFQLSPPISPHKPASQLDTPVPTEALITPSFTRRGLAAPSLLKDATHRAGSVASSSRSGSGVFSNMAFVLTSTGDGMDKDAVARTIKANGGRVLERGFHELFDTEPIELSASQSRRTSVTTAEGAGTLMLKDEFKKLGFVALITDSHSRSTKYLQALAINVPCLHLRWINDSLSASRSLSFARYLLPAGLSKYLDPHGIVRSRAMRIYDPSSDDVSFDKTFQERDLLLRGQSVLLVTGKSKKEIEKRQPFVFLTHALGASNVGRCADITAATQLLVQGKWDWVYVDSDQSSVADVAAALFGTSASAKTAKGSSKKAKKRKRDDGEPEELLSRGDVAGRKVRVASAEFVIQSLILGALVNE